MKSARKVLFTKDDRYTQRLDTTTGCGREFFTGIIKQTMHERKIQAKYDYVAQNDKIRGTMSRFNL